MVNCRTLWSMTTYTLLPYTMDASTTSSYLEKVSQLFEMTPQDAEKHLLVKYFLSLYPKAMPSTTYSSKTKLFTDLMKQERASKFCPTPQYVRSCYELKLHTWGMEKHAASRLKRLTEAQALELSIEISELYPVADPGTDAVACR